MGRRPSLGALLGGVLLLAIAAPAAGQRIPHEFFSYTGPAGAPGAEADLPEPGRAAGGAAAGGAVFGPDGPLLPETPGRPADQNGALDDQEPVRLDADTGGEGQLPYAVVYEPSIAPHKRAGARDLVQWDEQGAWLGVRDPTLRPVALTPTRRPDFDAYEGRLTVRARSQVPIPLPSVAPQMEIHSIRALPAVPVTITRDGTDLYYVQVPVDGEVQLTLSVSADPTYANGGLDGLTPSRRAASQVPPAFAAQARTVIDAIGVPATATDVEAVALLVAWFSDFDASPPPDPLPAQQDLYQTLSLARAGVCRHRAQAFVLTAAALGIPSRYVHNEAHAFVEVQFREGWRRFDLGGDAAGLDLIGGPQSPSDSDDNPDSPPTDGESAGAAPAATPGSGDPGGNEAPRDAASPDAPGDGPGGNEQHHGTAGAEQPGDDAPPAASGEAAITRPPNATPPTSHYEAEGLAIGPGEPERGPSRLRVSLGEQRRYRREPLTVRGRLTGLDGTPIGDQPVVLLLRDAAGTEAPLGEVRTDAAGAFVVVLPVPGAVPVGTWHVVARFDGASRWEPSTSHP